MMINSESSIHLGFIDKSGLVSAVKLSTLIQSMRIVPTFLDPFQLELIGSTTRLYEARQKIYETCRLPMNGESGEAVGNLIRCLEIPSRHLKNAIYCKRLLCCSVFLLGSIDIQFCCSL